MGGALCLGRGAVEVESGGGGGGRGGRRLEGPELALPPARGRLRSGVRSMQRSPAGQAMAARALSSAQSRAGAAGRESASGGLPASSFVTEEAQASRGAGAKSAMRSSARGGRGEVEGGRTAGDAPRGNSRYAVCRQYLESESRHWQGNAQYAVADTENNRVGVVRL